MNRSKSMIKVSFFFACMLCFMAASQASAEPGKQEDIVVKIQSNSIDGRVANISARKEGENVVIDGVVRRTKETKGSLPVGSVDFSIHDGKGKPVEKSFVQIPSTGSYRSGAAENKFIERMPTMVMTGEHVDVTYHNGPHRG